MVGHAKEKGGFFVLVLITIAIAGPLLVFGIWWDQRTEGTDSGHFRRGAPREYAAASTDEALTLLQKYLDEGSHRYVRADFRGAATAWEQALIEARRQRNEGAERFLHNKLGKTYNTLGDYPQALAHYQQSLAIARERVDRREEGVFLGNLGSVYDSLADYPKALTHQEQSLGIARKIGDRALEENALNSLGVVYGHFAHYPKALAYGEQALVIARELGDQAGESRSLNNLGNIYESLADYPKAITYHEQSLGIARKLGDQAQEGGSLNNLGIVYESLADYPKALTYSEQSLAIARKIDDQAGESRSLNNLGNIYESLADYLKAITYHEQSLAIARKVGDRNGEAASLINHGLVYASLGDYRKALAYDKQALDAFRAISLDSGVLTAGTNAGVAYMELGLLEEARVIFERSNDPIALGHYYIQVSEPDKARVQFARSLAKDEQSGNTEWLLADHIGLGLAAEGLKEYAEARDHYRTAVETIEHQRATLTDVQRRQFFAGKVLGFSRLEPYEGLVRVSLKLNNPAAAFHWAEHTKARALLDAVAHHGDGNRLGLSDDLVQQETDLTQQLASLTKQREIVLEKQNSERLQEIDRELPKLQKEQEALIAQVREKYPAYAALRYPQPIQSADVKLSPGEALIAYEVTEPATYAWLIQDGKIVKTLTIPVNRKDLSAEVERFRAVFQTVAKTRQVQDLKGFDPRLGARLYALLFKDFASLLGQTKRLVIVLDEVLGLLPFEALIVQTPNNTVWETTSQGPAPKGVRYQGDSYRLVYAQSATALMQTRARADTPSGTGLLVVADPVFDVADTRVSGAATQLAQSTTADSYHTRVMGAVEDWAAGGTSGGNILPRLEATGKLPMSLSGLAAPIEALSGITATEPKVRERLQTPHPQLLFATHGLLDGDLPYVQEPALVLTQVGVDSTQSERDGFLTLTEVMGLKLPAELAVLSACQTGLGRRLTGEGVMGMGRAFQYAGVRQVLMSLWSVDEAATVRFVERLFAHLKEGQDTLAALGQARADLRQAGYAHPYYWAPFILVGG